MITSTLLRACKLIYCGRSITKPRMETKEQQRKRRKEEVTNYTITEEKQITEEEKYNLFWKNISFRFALRADLVSLADTNWLSIEDSWKPLESPCQEPHSPIIWENTKKNTNTNINVSTNTIPNSHLLKYCNNSLEGDSQKPPISNNPLTRQAPGAMNHQYLVLHEVDICNDVTSQGDILGDKWRDKYKYKYKDIH